MCVAMVIIHTKTLEKKGVNDVTSKESNFEQREPPTMSQGTALFSCGIMETGRWRDVGRSCAIQQRPVGSSLESLWDVLPEACQGGTGGCGREVGAATGTISTLLQDLSLSETGASPSANAAPPSKRQCRSPSCSEEPAGCQSPWRPQGSRVWTAVEKRRCYSGGSAQRGGQASAHAGAPAAFPAVRRSSSFSLPARANSLEPPCFGRRLPPFPSFAGPLYLSHEQICLPEPCSSPDSTPELGRRCTGRGGLARSRSQPCVLNDKKAGMKRRRPADTHKQRPSLDLAKMTQKLRNFHSLSCPGITGDDCCQSSHVPPTFSSTHQCETDFTSVHDQGAEPHLSTKEGRGDGEDSSIDEPGADSPGCVDSAANGKEYEPLWAGMCGTRRDAGQLGGELDIEQIERN